MPQKNGKKSKVEKSKKPVKPVKGASLNGNGKKPTKVAAKKPAPAVAKKASDLPKKSAGKPAKPEKKPIALKKKAPVELPSKGKKLPEKPKVVAKPAPAPAPVKPNGKKKEEIVVEVPAPKGVALLKEGKKKGKSASESTASSKKRCREPGCDQDSLMSGYCRLHYIKNWRKIKRKEAILASGQLNSYVEELVNKYPDKYLDVIRQDLASEKEWAKVVIDLELESSDEEAAGDEDLEGVAEGVSRGRGEFEDDSESF